MQLLETGLLHADPHPGNLLYTTEGCIGFLDFGLLCRLKKEHQNAMLASIVHIVNKDWEGLAYDLVSMDVVLPGTNLHHVTVDLAEALGVIHYRDGIPDIKFSLVLGKVWSIALKYHFRMPPYFTLVLRSLASFEGMAVAADKNFRTFQAAYPYVINKLLYDNSASTRRTLYSVIFNKTREIQWQKILLILKIGSLRIRSTGINSSSSNMPEHKICEQDVYKLANLMLMLLPSRNGAVLRRLLMTADPVSLTRAVISKNAITFRRHASVVLADVICRRLLKACIGDDASSRYTGLLLEVEGQVKTSYDSQFYTIMRDHRLRLIFYRLLGQVRRHPVLMVRACWSCFTIAAMALVISLPRFIAYCSLSFVSSLSFLPRKIAVGFQP